MLTYTLTDTGYTIYRDGSLWVQCPFDPTKGGFMPFADDDAKRAHITEHYPDAVPG